MRRPGGHVGARRALHLVTLAATVASACVDYVTEDEGAQMPVVLSILEAGTDSAFVAVGRAGPGTSTAPARGAVLSLQTPGGDVALMEVQGSGQLCGAPPGFTCYVAPLPAPLAPGDTVVLRGFLPSGQELNGSTRIPPVPPVEVGGLSPGDTVRFIEGTGTPPRVVLGDGSGRVVGRDEKTDATVWVGGRGSVCPIWIYYPSPKIDLRTSGISGLRPVALSDPSCDRRVVTDWDSLSAPVVMLGFDPNATAWYETNGAFWPEEVTATLGLQGALGVFGSATPASFALRLIAAESSSMSPAPRR